MNGAKRFAVFSVPTHNCRVPHISLVFREMWDTTGLSLNRRLVIKLEGRRGGIPHLAKNERDMGHPAIVGRDREEGVELPNPFHAICSLGAANLLIAS